MSRRRKLEAQLRPWLERLGLPWLSRPALNGLDRRLADLLPQRGGWFVEAGGNDGFQQSNTYYLARFRGWRGVLVEPVPELAAACRARRPESQIFECALSAPNHLGATIPLRCAGLMTNVCGALADEAAELRRAAGGLAIQGLPVEERVIEVPARSLSAVLDESGIPADFDLLSLDVEGYEVEVLKGLDLEKHRPRAICVEVRRQHLELVHHLLGEHYQMVETFHENASHGDYFWRRRGVSRSG